ncbi:MAG TPA: matrixin family metalloprotease [Gemmataceae bacterium]|jgi:hypothetical protein|nr:matrixin family metalloprotease [Gemmataceae bacterium]
MAFLGLLARFGCARRSATRTAPARRQARPRLEGLEDRVVPYAASGNFWPNSQLVTISFVPDGTNLGGVSSDLFAEFNARFGAPATWENVVLKAAQVWAQQTNLNFAVVSDSGADSGSGLDQQGDPTMGDIRIGGFDFQNSGVLALTYMPPAVNNYSIAGDIGINTAQTFNINGNDYDLFTVMVHEFGHALGLDHSTSATAVMYPTYQGLDIGLGFDDIAGIQSIYGGSRQPDAFDAVASNGSFATASDITSFLDPTSDIAQLTGLDITSTSDLDYYSFVAPDDANGTMTISVQSAGLSLLAPSLRVYNANQQQIGLKTGTGDFGTTLALTMNVTPGATYYVRVAGANQTAFGTGAYAMTVDLGADAAPAVAAPDTTIANGNPINGGGGVANRKDANGLSVTGVLIGLDRTINKLTHGLLGGLVSRLVDRIISDAVELPFADPITIRDTGSSGPGNDFGVLPAPVLQSAIGTVFDVEASVKPTNPAPTAASTTTAPPVTTLAPPQVVLGIGASDTARASFDVLGARPDVMPEPSAISAASTWRQVSNLPISAHTSTSPSALAAPTPIVAAENNDDAGPEARPAAVLSLFALAVGLNPPLSADERHRPSPGH